MGTDEMIVGGTSIASFGLSLLIVVLTFHSPSFGDNMKSKWFKSLDCDELYVQTIRPFRFTLTEHKSDHGPYSCPWPTENTAFRATLAFVTLGLSAAVAWCVHENKREWVRRSSTAYAMLAAFWLAIGTLDADGLRAGNDTCRDSFKVTDDEDGKTSRLINFADGVSLTCSPGPFVWLTCADYFAVLVCLSATYVWWRFSAVDVEVAHLQDPFLTSMGGGGGSDAAQPPNGPMGGGGDAVNAPLHPSGAYDPTKIQQQQPGFGGPMAQMA